MRFERKLTAKLPVLSLETTSLVSPSSSSLSKDEVNRIIADRICKNKWFLLLL